MSDFFENWALALSGVIVFGSMCEMILPNGVYKKYIHLTIGIMLVMTVLKPVTNFKGDIKAEIPNSTGKYAENLSTEMRQSEDVIRIYKAKLCEQIAAKFGGGVEVECEVYDGEQNFGKIERVYIMSKNPTDNIDNIKNGIAEDLGIAADRVIVKENTYGN